MDALIVGTDITVINIKISLISISTQICQVIAIYVKYLPSLCYKCSANKKTKFIKSLLVCETQKARGRRESPTPPFAVKEEFYHFQSNFFLFSHRGCNSTGLGCVPSALFHQFMPSSSISFLADLFQVVLLRRGRPKEKFSVNDICAKIR